MARKQPYVDDLGYIPGEGPADTERPDVVDLRADRFGLPHSVRAEIEAAVAQEDAPSDEAEIEQQCYAMERAIARATKDRMFVELVEFARDMRTLILCDAMVNANNPALFEAYELTLKHGRHRETRDFISWFSAQRPGVDLDRTLFRWARRSLANPDITKAEARDWKP
jgi:hypothetical protein